MISMPFLGVLPFPRFFELEISAEYTYNLAVTVFHAGVVLAQMGNAFACRSEKSRNSRLGWISNKYLLLGVAAEFLGIWIMVYQPNLATYLQHKPLPLEYWAGLASFPLILYSLEWIRKQAVRWGESRTHTVST